MRDQTRASPLHQLVAWRQTVFNQNVCLSMTWADCMPHGETCGIRRSLRLLTWKHHGPYILNRTRLHRDWPCRPVAGDLRVADPIHAAKVPPERSGPPPLSSRSWAIRATVASSPRPSRAKASRLKRRSICVRKARVAQPVAKDGASALFCAAAPRPGFAKNSTPRQASRTSWASFRSTNS